MSNTQMQRASAQSTLPVLLQQPGYQARFKDVLRDRAPQFVSSLIQVGNSLGADCDPLTIISGGMIAASLDLPINKNLGFAWLVPYKERGQKKAQFQMGYKGYIQLALRTGQYSRMNAGPINRECLGGWDEVGERVVDFSKFDPAKPAAAYFLAFRMVNGFTKVAVWTKEDVEAHARQYSQSYRGGYDSPWKSHFDQMAVKTVIANELRQWGILSVEMQRAMETDGAVVAGLDNPNIEFPDAPVKVVEVEVSEPEPASRVPDDNSDTPPMGGPTPLSKSETVQPPVEQRHAAPTPTQEAPKRGPLDNTDKIASERATPTQEAPPPIQEDPSVPVEGSNQHSLMRMVASFGYGWDVFVKFMEGSGIIPNCSSLSGFGEIDSGLAGRVMRARDGLRKGLRVAAGESE